MPQTIGFVRTVKMQTFPEADRFMGFLLGASEDTILFLSRHHTILQNSIKYNKENEVVEDSMQAVIIPPRFKDNYQTLGLPREWREYFISLDVIASWLHVRYLQCHIH